MEAIRDFEDILELFERHQVRYLVVGGLAFTFHAMPRYTKDIDLWIDAEKGNVERANLALREFGSPEFLDPTEASEILQIGTAPNRVDILRDAGPVSFDRAWAKRVESRYGKARVNWIDLDTLIDIKSAIDHPRHREDARILRMVKNRRS